MIQQKESIFFPVLYKIYSTFSFFFLFASDARIIKLNKHKIKLNILSFFYISVHLFRLGDRALLFCWASDLLKMSRVVFFRRVFGGGGD